jgi:hypothetical protein
MPDVKVGWRSGTVPSLLDTYTGAAAAYSLRKLRNAYSGFAIRVRRSSDNTEQNIGFTATGGLDTTALLSFVGAGNGFVTTWYDQSGNNRDATQTTAGNQPQIVSNGVINTFNSKPCVKFDGSNDFIQSPYAAGTSNELYFVTQTTDASFLFPRGITGYGFVADQSNTSTNTSNYLLTQPQLYVNSVLSSPANRGAVYNLLNGYKLSVHKGVDISNNFNYLRFGSFIQDGTFDFNGNLFEWIIYPTLQSSQSSIESNINSYYSVWDNDAEAFITATGISTISTGYANSIRTLVTTLKSANIWSKLKAVYPFVGGTANTHKFNLKDPRDLDAAYRLNFYGGWNHYTSGPYGNGFNTYADTNLNPSVALSPNSSSIGIWTPTGMNNHGFGVWSNSGANRFAITEYGGGFVDSQMTSPTTRAWGITYTTSGFIMGSRTSATSNKIYRFGSQIAVHPSYGGVPHNTTTNTADYPNANFWLGRVNGNTSINYYNNSLYFAYIADGLTDAEILALSNAAYTFRQSIGHY